MVGMDQTVRNHVLELPTRFHQITAAQNSAIKEMANVAWVAKTPNGTMDQPLTQLRHKIPTSAHKNAHLPAFKDSAQRPAKESVI